MADTQAPNHEDYDWTSFAGAAEYLKASIAHILSDEKGQEPVSTDDQA